MNIENQPVQLTITERNAIVEILTRRSNEIAGFKYELEKKTGTTKFDELPGSVELALSREIRRLRNIADKVRVPAPIEEDEE